MTWQRLYACWDSFCSIPALSSQCSHLSGGRIYGSELPQLLAYGEQVFQPSRFTRRREWRKFAHVCRWPGASERGSFACMSATDRIELVEGDITKLQVDAVVTAANESLLGGGGVDGAIHRAAGPQLLEECKTIGICPEGQARITRGYRLPAKYIIHAVGPVYENGSTGESEVLASAYRAALELALQHRIETIAFPCISTGAYGFPKPEASKIAVSTVSEFLSQNVLPRKVVFCCYDEEDSELYRSRLGHPVE